MQLYKHILKDCVWTRILQITALRVIREKTAAHMEHTQAGMNLDSVCCQDCNKITVSPN